MLLHVYNKKQKKEPRKSETKLMQEDFGMTTRKN